MICRHYATFLQNKKAPLAAYTGGMYIKVRVVAGAKKESVEKISDTSYKLAVKEPAKQNLANRRVIELMAFELKVPKAQIRLISGHQSPSKMLSVGE